MITKAPLLSSMAGAVLFVELFREKMYFANLEKCDFP
jgi:hypothetical protein